MKLGTALTDFGRMKNLLASNGHRCTNLKKGVDLNKDAFQWPIIFMVTDLHCIGCWRDFLFDASHTHCLPFSKEHLDWCCGHGMTFSGVFGGFMFEPLKKKKIVHINNNSKI